MIRDFEESTGWTAIYRSGNGRGRTCLLVAPGRTINAYGWHELSPATEVGKWGAGPAKVGRKWICWAIVDGLLIGVVHFVASVQRPAVTKNQRRQRAERRALWRRQAREVVEWSHSRQADGEALVVGDLNATRRYDDLDILRRGGFELHTRASLKGRGIDYLGGRGIDVDQVKALPGYLRLSDHRPVAGTITH